MTLGLYGGSFNPPHIGHSAVARDASQALGLDLLIWMPSGNPPHKDLPENTPSPHHRLEMSKIASANIPNAEVSPFELDGGARYTIDTVRFFSGCYKPDVFWLIIGGDMLKTFESWYEAKALSSLCRIAAYARTESERITLESCAAKLLEALGASVTVLPMAAQEVSSTLLRESLYFGEGGELLPDGVFEYIVENRLYGYSDPLSPACLREAVRDGISVRRAAHILGVERIARSLAKRWGADEKQASQAALLHDMTKEAPDQLKLSGEYGILPVMLESSVPNTLHAITGAARSAALGAVPDVVNAVRWHTTGRPDMSLLEKIIYIADLTEESRGNAPELEEVRRLSLDNLDEALCFAVTSKLRHVRSRGREIDAAAYETEEWVKHKSASKNPCQP